MFPLFLSPSVSHQQLTLTLFEIALKSALETSKIAGLVLPHAFGFMIGSIAVPYSVCSSQDSPFAYHLFKEPD